MRLAAVLIVVLVPTVACGDDGGDASGCGQVQRERLDSSSTRHLLPGAPEPSYATDPPTSGAHSSARPPTGALTQPLSRPDQVALLEAGGVLVQDRDLSRADRRRLEGLAGEGVTVAPNPDLPARVVATAWTLKMTCDDVDLEALRTFVREHLGDALHQ